MEVQPLDVSSWAVAPRRCQEYGGRSFKSRKDKSKFLNSFEAEVNRHFVPSFNSFSQGPLLIPTTKYNRLSVFTEIINIYFNSSVYTK